MVKSTFKNKKAIIIIITMIILAIPFVSYGQVGKPSNTTLSINKQLLIIENLLEEGQSKSLETEISKLQNLKKISSVFFIPELNYLLEEPVEKIPPSYTEIFRNRIKTLDIVANCSLISLIILSIYTLIYASDKIFKQEISRNLSIFIGICLLLVSFLFYLPLFILFTSLFAGINLFKKEKIFFGIIALLTLSSFILTINYENLLGKKIQDNRTLLASKTLRDNYAPSFLIEKIRSNEIKNVIKLSNKQALLDPISPLVYEDTANKTSNIKIKALCYNNIGCFLFSLNKTQEALNYFKKAEKLYPSPKIIFNLFTTYSSLLQLKKAEQYQNKLKELNIFYLKEIPIVMNYSDITSIPNINIIYAIKTISPLMLLYLIAGIFLGSIVTKKIKEIAQFTTINPVFNKFPGYKFYHSNNYSALFLLLVFLNLLEVLWRLNYHG